MVIFIIRRLVWGVMLCFVVTLITFLMFFVLPADSRSAQRNERGFQPDLQTQFNLRGSLPEQYVRFLGQIVLHGSLGDSNPPRAPGPRSAPPPPPRARPAPQPGRRPARARRSRR